MLGLMMVLVVAVTPVEKIFQSFHLYKTTHRKVVAAGYTMCCVRSKLITVVYARTTKVLRNAGCLRDAAFTQLFPKVLLSCRSAHQQRVLACG